MCTHIFVSVELSFILYQRFMELLEKFQRWDYQIEKKTTHKICLKGNAAFMEGTQNVGNIFSTRSVDSMLFFTPHKLY